MNKGLTRSCFLETALLCALCLCAASCGGGGGGGNTAAPPTQAAGAVQGYVYAAAGSGARAAGATPAGFSPVAGAAVGAACGAVSRTGQTDASGRFLLQGLPAGACTITASMPGFVSAQAAVTVIPGQTVTAGGAQGLALRRAQSGAIRVTANVPGAALFLDGASTGVTLPDSLEYTFEGAAEGQHAVSASATVNGRTGQQTVQVSVARGQTALAALELNPPGNRAPAADPGPDAKWFSGTRYIHEGWNGSINVFTPAPIDYVLDGSGSADPDGDALTYRWEQITGPAAALSATGAGGAVFAPPDAGEYKFGLSVSDGFLRSATGTVTVSVARLTGKLVFKSSIVQTNWEIYSMNADGSALRRLTENLTNDTNPAWCGGGDRIVYACASMVAPRDNICRMNSDGTGVEHLTSADFEDWGPSCSPDGKTLLWVKGVPTENSGEVFSKRIGGESEKQLTNFGTGQKAFPRFSPDGEMISFEVFFGGNKCDIFTANANGSGQIRLTDGNTDNGMPTWTPDGRILYTNSDTLGGVIKHLYSVLPDGGDLRDEIMPANERRMFTPRVSADGRFIFYEDHNGFLKVMYADGSASMSYGMWGSTLDYTPDE